MEPRDAKVAAAEEKSEGRARDEDSRDARPKPEVGGTERAALDRVCCLLPRCGPKDAGLQDELAQRAVGALGITKGQLLRLKKRFERMDWARSGRVGVDALLESLGEPATPYTDALFRAVGVDGSGAIDFDAYVRVVVGGCMLGKEDILRVAFDCAVEDGSGSMDEREFAALCRSVHGAGTMFHRNIAVGLRDVDLRDDGLIGFREFQDLNERRPLLLHPCFRLQQALWRRTLGEQAWARIRERVRAQLRARGSAPERGGGAVHWIARCFGRREGDGALLREYRALAERRGIKAPGLSAVAAAARRQA